MSANHLLCRGIAQPSARREPSYNKMMSMVNRIFMAFGPPKVEKKSDAIKFGILGAAKIALVILGLCHVQCITDNWAARLR